MHWTADYLGKPWRNGADGPDAFDCYGLVRAVYRDRYGIEMPVVSADATRVLACLHAACRATPSASAAFASSRRKRSVAVATA